MSVYLRQVINGYKEYVSKKMNDEKCKFPTTEWDELFEKARIVTDWKAKDSKWINWKTRKDHYENMVFGIDFLEAIDQMPAPRIEAVIEFLQDEIDRRRKAPMQRTKPLIFENSIRVDEVNRAICCMGSINGIDNNEIFYDGETVIIDKCKFPNKDIKERIENWLDEYTYKMYCSGDKRK